MTWISEWRKPRIPQLFSYPNFQPWTHRQDCNLCQPRYSWEDSETRKILGICFIKKSMPKVAIFENLNSSSGLSHLRKVLPPSFMELLVFRINCKTQIQPETSAALTYKANQGTERNRSQGSASHLLIYKPCFRLFPWMISRKSQSALWSCGILFSVPQEHFLHNRHLSVRKKKIVFPFDCNPWFNSSLLLQVH